MTDNAPRALLVEDERQIRRFVRTALEAEGWQVVEADTLKQGLIDAGTRKPDLVILDLGLPDGNGVEFIHAFRGWSSVPVIVLSARVDESDKIAALDAGADDYLTKPFGVGELLARVRATLRRQAAPTSASDAVFRFGDVEVDQANRVVRKAGATLHLTPIEYRLLTLLHRQRRQGAHASAPAARGLGPELRREQSLRAHLRRAPAAEARGRSRATAPHPDRDRRRVPLSTLATATMTTTIGTPATKPKRTRRARARLATLTLSALGVVYGDIGTSPLYALKEVFGGTHHPVPINEANVLGILSLVFWSLMIVVSIKYVVFILRANNKGEGGIMALMALVLRNEKDPSRARALMLLGLFGAALFYGDGLITPAISVLSAVEGLEVATPAFKPYVLPITLGVLVVLFFVQKRGTGSVGALFGPVMVVWFGTLATLGVQSIARVPQVLAALNPAHAVSFLATHGALGFFSLGAVVLVVTGAEALYADMGHFGSGPVRIAWSCRRAPGAGPQLFRAGRAAPHRSRDHREPLLPARAGMGALSAGRAGDDGHDHRVAGGDLRRLLDHAAGDAAGLCAADGRAAHVEPRDGADLPAGNQPGAVPRRRRAGAGVRFLDEPRRGLRHRGHGHDGDHDGACFRRRAADVALEPGMPASRCSAPSWSWTSDSSPPTR